MKERRYHKYLDTQIVFQEFPDEITYAINITNCPNNCPGCHSQELAKDIGDILDESVIDDIMKEQDTFTCIGFMGGDSNPREVVNLAKYIREKYPDKKVGWYSGRDVFPLEHGVFHYIKLGAWKTECGPLTSPTTNQVMYMNISEKSDNYMNPTFVDITEKAFRSPKPWEGKKMTRKDIKEALDKKEDI